MKQFFLRAYILIVTPALLVSACVKDDVITDDSGDEITDNSGNTGDDSGDNGDGSGDNGDEITEAKPRPVLPESLATFDKVYEWTPAPGQYINEGVTLTTPEEAASWAQERLGKGLFVSLGGFGGYIVVGFDHSVVSSSTADYDFAIAGNAFLNASTSSGGSNEPGIVYVMQDTNGNGLPDDEWFELKGSEYDSDDTIHNYEITYQRPSSPGMNTEWSDNLGNTGCIDYLASFHKQDYYYPLWIEADSYTLSGTALKPRNQRDPATGMWNNDAYSWGYADNMGADNFSYGNFNQCNRFRISDAVKSDGSPADLLFIDFVKVQTGVCAKSGWLGELSTEVLGFFDLGI